MSKKMLIDSNPTKLNRQTNSSHAKLKVTYPKNYNRMVRLILTCSNNA